MKTKQLLTAAVAAVLLSATTLFAQVKIGDNPTTINAGSVLELESTNKALLLPRIALTNTTTWAPLLGTPAAGMHLYNTNVAITGTVAYPTTPAQIGEYYWDGTGWVALSPVGAQTTPVQVGVNVAAQALTGGASTTLFPIVFGATSKFDIGGNRVGNTVVIPSAGLYEFSGLINYAGSGTTPPSSCGFRVNKNGVLIQQFDANIVVNGVTDALNGIILDRLNAGDVISFVFATSGPGSYQIINGYLAVVKLSD